MVLLKLHNTTQYGGVVCTSSGFSFSVAGVVHLLKIQAGFLSDTTKPPYITSRIYSGLIYI